MSDGAHLGVTPNRALQTILGGEEEPTEDERMTVEQERDWLLSAPRWDDPAAQSDYDECARVVAGECLRWALAHPAQYSRTACETEYDFAADPDHGSNGCKPEYMVRRSLYDVLKEHGIRLDTLGITGFQWGWAYNAAARCLELPPQPNPALITIGDDIDMAT